MKKNTAEYEIERFCAFCEHASPLIDDSEMLCFHRGVVGKRFTCRKFIYDPLKRKPRRKIIEEPEQLSIDFDKAILNKENAV